MSNLSKFLQGYLTYKGNKILFKNRFSLNELATLMWEKLGYKEVDASVLSRVIHGERLFTPAQLEIFCRILFLRKDEKGRLKRALSQDILSRSNIHTEDFILQNGQNYNDLIDVLRTLRKDGHPEKVISLSQLLGSDIKNQRSAGLIYNEISRAFGEISSPKTVLNLMGGLNRKAIHIGEDINDREILDMAYMNVGGAYYVAKRWKDSSLFLESKFANVRIETKLEFLRTLILDYAYQGDYSKFKEALRRVTKVIDKNYGNNYGVIASIHEAISRSLSIFGFTKEARKILDEIKKIKLDPFFRSQILRGYIFTFYAEKGTKRIDYDSLKSILKRINEEKFSPYVRHNNEIKKMIKNLRTAKSL